MKANLSEEEKNSIEEDLKRQEISLKQMIITFEEIGFICEEEQYRLIFSKEIKIESIKDNVKIYFIVGKNEVFHINSQLGNFCLNTSSYYLTAEQVEFFINCNVLLFNVFRYFVPSVSYLKDDFKISQDWSGVYIYFNGEKSYIKVTVHSTRVSIQRYIGEEIYSSALTGHERVEDILDSHTEFKQLKGTGYFIE